MEIVSEFRFQNWANLSEVINIYPPWNAQKVFWMLLLTSSLVQSFNTTELNQMHCSLQLGIKLKIPVTILFSSELLSIIIIFCKFTLTLHKGALYYYAPKKWPKFGPLPLPPHFFDFGNPPSPSCKRSKLYINPPTPLSTTSIAQYLNRVVL